MSKDQDNKRSSLLNKTFESAFDKCIPLVTTIEITQHCNFKCKHCYNFDRSAPIPEKIVQDYMKPHEIIDAIDQVASLGSLYVNISGGEALMHPHINDFIKRIRNHHMEPRLKSNGLMLSKTKLDELKSIGLNAIDISLYGSTEKTYREFTGQIGALDKVKESLIYAKNTDYDINVNIILHRFNTEELASMISFCEENNLRYQISTETTERYDKSVGARDFEITNDQFEKLLTGAYGHFFMVDNSERALQCSCARSVCGIGSNGDVYPCIGAPIISGNLKENNLQTIWNESSELKKIREIKEENFEECMKCDYIDYCGRSSGTCYVNNQNYTGCDKSFIDQAKIRFKHKDLFKK